MMDVYTDLRWPSISGIGVVAREVLSRAPPDVRVIDLKPPSRVGSPLSPLAISYSLLRRRAASGVFWNPGFIPPVFSRVQRVITIHDLTHLHFYTRAHAAYYRAVYKPLFKRIEQIICVSKYTSKELCEWSGLDADRVKVIYNGVSGVFRPRHDQRRTMPPYFFYPGNRRSYKNLDRLIRAFAASRLPRDGFRLVLSGHRDDTLLRLAAMVGCLDKLAFAGILSDAELAMHYANAHGVTYVSLYEGFGLPVLEGMASGVPVLTSNVSALPEIAGDAAVLVNPLSIEEIRAGLELIAYQTEIRDTCIKRGLARAEEFSWETTANSTWSLIRSIGSRPRVS